MDGIVADRSVAPTPDEVEVSLIGPGYGECVLVHFGHGAWIVVDSCIDVRTRRPVALDYLESLALDPEVVRLVVATHWHDDHIRGLAEVIRAAPKARLVVSTALRSEELATLVSFVEPRMMERSSGVAELAAIYAHLQETRSPLEFAAPDRRLWRPAGKLRRAVWSLSPSDRSIEIALQGIAKLVDDPQLPNRRVPSLQPNHTAVVLWCELPEVAVLLGSDLENTEDEQTGWRAILASTARPDGRSAIFKVPHHGSVTGHNPEVWSELLEADVISVTTPFVHGRTHLPTPADRSRIASLSSAAYLSSDTPATTASWTPPVASTIQEATITIRDAEPHPGHIRLRRPVSGGAWTVELFSGAVQV